MELKFAERFKSIRLELKLSQYQIADILGVSQSRVAKWESGQLEPNLTMLLKISVELDTTIDYLLGRTDYEK